MPVVIASLRWERGYSIVSKQYDNLNRLTRIQSSTGVSPVSDFQYGYNAANQRTNIVLGPDNSRWAFGYDSLGQVTSGKKHWPDGTPVAGQQFEYQFDSIGNRRQTQAGGDNSGAGLRPAAYTNNLLNQIVGRWVPGAADVLGLAHASASVTVNGQATSRKGEYFWKEVGANNTNGVVNLGITNQAVLAGVTNIATGDLLLPMAGQRYWYDADGNMLSDGVWTNTWDAENRLIATETTAAVPEAARAKEIWSYYADGRWSERVVYAWTNGNWVAQATQRFIWDGNLIVAILDGNNSLLQTFLRGLDLSGTMQGAGGAGGLLALGDLPSGMTYFYVHDGNGNVVALVSATDGSVVARYEYGPFAEPIRMTGPMALANPMRFSGQFADDLHGTVKYLFREYEPSAGRWLNPDPIDERGGINLYVIVANALGCQVDSCGLFFWDITYLLASKGSTPQIVRLACVCERRRAFEFAQLQDDGPPGPRGGGPAGLIICRILTNQYSGNTVHTKPLTVRHRPCIFRP